VYFCANQVSGTEMSKWLNELCPIILDMLQDASLIAKREVTYMYIVQCTCQHHKKRSISLLDKGTDSVKTMLLLLKFHYVRLSL